MGRIREYVEIGEENSWTLFDSGARNTYVIKGVASKLPTFDLPKPNPISLVPYKKYFDQEWQENFCHKGTEEKLYSRRKGENGRNERF